MDLQHKAHSDSNNILKKFHDIDANKMNIIRTREKKNPNIFVGLFFIYFIVYCINFLCAIKITTDLVA